MGSLYNVGTTKMVNFSFFLKKIKVK